MPSNIIKINSAKELEWYVSDSKMDDLLKYLDEIGHRTSQDNTTSSDASS